MVLRCSISHFVPTLLLHMRHCFFFLIVPLPSLFITFHLSSIIPWVFILSSLPASLLPFLPESFFVSFSFNHFFPLQALAPGWWWGMSYYSVLDTSTSGNTHIYTDTVLKPTS